MLRNIKSAQRNMRLVNCSKTGLGTASILAGIGALQCSVAKNGTGDYTITFVTPFATAPICQVSSLTADVVCRISAVTTSTVRVICRSVAASPAAAECDFTMTAHGLDGTDLY